MPDSASDHSIRRALALAPPRPIQAGSCPPARYATEAEASRAAGRASAIGLPAVWPVRCARGHWHVLEAALTPLRRGGPWLAREYHGEEHGRAGTA